MTASTIEGFKVVDNGNHSVIMQISTGRTYDCPLYGLGPVLEALDAIVNGVVKPVEPEAPRKSFDEFKIEFAKDQAEAEAWATANAVEVKAIKYSPTLSDDSNAFTATIFIKGKKYGSAKDDGNGGIVMVYRDPKAVAKLTPAEEGYLESHISKVVDDYVNQKGITEAENRAKRSASKKGHKFLAIKWKGASLSYISGMTKDGLEKWLVDKKEKGYTIVAL
jgi:hypothetical protein